MSKNYFESSGVIKMKQRPLILLGVSLVVILVMGYAGNVIAQKDSVLKDYDPIHSELVMNLVVTCSKPERMGPSFNSKDGIRGHAWYIIGGKFWGPNIKGTVIPGGADFPVVRRDGVVVVDALYSLRTDDGTIIMIHNRGLGYDKADEKYRLAPEFTVNEGKYDWLNKSIFVATLVSDIPESMRLAKGPNENDRLIQVHRIY
jgi:hypothetical protein